MKTLKVQIAIKYFLLIQLYFSCSVVFGQDALNGTYSKLMVGQEHFNYYKFNQQGYFEYYEGASQGYNYYGKGSYKISNNLLLLDYNNTELKEFSGYYRYTNWVNKNNEIILRFKIFDLDGNKIPNVNIYISKMKIGKITDLDGYAEIILNKNRIVDDHISISLIGFEPQKLSFDKKSNIEFKVYLKKRNLKSFSKPIYNQKDTLEIMNRPQNMINLRGKDGNVISLKKVSGLGYRKR
jgi:hypothetical protein